MPKHTITNVQLISGINNYNNYRSLRKKHIVIEEMSCYHNMYIIFSNIAQCRIRVPCSNGLEPTRVILRCPWKRYFIAHQFGVILQKI